MLSFSRLSKSQESETDMTATNSFRTKFNDSRTIVPILRLLFISFKESHCAKINLLLAILPR